VLDVFVSVQSPSAGVSLRSQLKLGFCGWQNPSVSPRELHSHLLSPRDALGHLPFAGVLPGCTGAGQ